MCQIQLLVLTAVTLAVFVAGCGKKGNQGVKVQGRLLKDGQPIKFLRTEDIRISFSSEASEGHEASGASGVVRPKDGAFTITGRDNMGLPPGKYRISLNSIIEGGGDDNRFDASVNRKMPPLVAEVGPEEGQSFTVDIGTWTVTKP
jgi:hypothetical protein